MTLFDTPVPATPAGFSVTRWHVLLTAGLALAAAALTRLPTFPFDRGGMLAVCAASTVMHFALFAFFDKVHGAVWNGANLFNILLLGFVIHFSGGILSPFTIFLLFIFVSGAAYGINYPLTVGLSIATFVVVVGGEALGFLAPLEITPAAVYACKPMTILIIMTNAAHLYTAGNIYRVTVKLLRGELEAELQRRESALRRIAALEAPSQIGQLVSKIAHDMRGPIGAVNGFVGLFARKNADDPDISQDCRVMAAELNRLAGMIDRMIAYVKPGEASTELIDVVELLETVLAVIHFHPAAKRARFVRDYPQGVRPLVSASKENLQRVFFNLVKNSLEALETQRGGRVAISVREQNGRAFIRVEDEGPGFADGLIENLNKGPASTKKDGGGMGLAISREIVEDFGGRMLLGRSILGGAEILIDLPSAPPPSQR